MSSNLKQAAQLQQVQPLAFRRGAVVSEGWRQYMSFDFWSNLVGGSSGLMLLVALVAVSFIAGYLAKRYIRFLLILFFVVFFIGAACEYAGIITIHWNVVCDLVGDAKIPRAACSLDQITLLVREYFIFIVASLISFIIGHSVR